MKKHTTLFAAALIATLSLFAQPNKGNRNSAGGAGKPQQEMQHKGLKDLNLTDAQKAELKAIKEKYHTSFQALRKQDEITVKEQRTRMETLRKDQKAATNKVFTPAQKEQMKQQQADRTTKMKAGIQERSKKVAEKLNLTATQQADIQKLREANQAQMKSLKDVTGTDKMAKMKAIKESEKTAMAKILTPEQLESFHKMQQGPRGKMNRRGGPHKPMHGKKPTEVVKK